MDPTQAESLPTLEQAERDAMDNTPKRAASPSFPDTSNKRSALALPAKDTCTTNDGTSSLLAEDKPCEGLRDSLEEDEQFLELSQLFDLVGVVAKKYGLDDELLHRNYRGQDALSCLRNRTGKWNISMSRARSFQPVTVVADSVRIDDGKKHRQETFVLGREKEEGPQWLTASFHLDTQLPHLVLRIEMPPTADAKDKHEYVFVNIFATNLARDPKMPVRMRTGKGVIISRSRVKRLTRTRPGLAKKLEECLITETSLTFNRVSTGHTDVEGRVNRPVIVGDVAHAELNRMAAEAVSGKRNQLAHEKLLGLIHGDHLSHGLVLYSEYDRKDTTGEYAREHNLCKLFSLAMILCNELGNFWAYRLQYPDVSWTNENLPFKELLPPRWTVRKWLARADKAVDGQAVAAATPAQWQAINRPKVLPGAEEELFLRGLDAVEDDPSSMRALVRKDFTHDSDGQAFIPRSV